MKWSMLALAVVLFSVDAQAEEYQVAGVFCKDKDDLLKAFEEYRAGTHLPDALDAIAGCKIVTESLVKVEDVTFIEWTSAIVEKMRIYKGTVVSQLIPDGERVPLSDSIGEWFFTPTAASKIPMPQDTKKGVPA